MSDSAIFRDIDVRGNRTYPVRRYSDLLLGGGVSFVLYRELGLLLLSVLEG